MASRDPAERAMMRMEIRRYASRCDADEAMLQRADSLREIARLAARPLPSTISGENEARDAQRRLALAAEMRAKDLILEQLAAFGKAEEEQRQRIRKKLVDELANLTGALGHLRAWAQNKLAAAEQML